MGLALFDWKCSRLGDFVRILATLKHYFTQTGIIHTYMHTRTHSEKTTSEMCKPDLIKNSLEASAWDSGYTIHNSYKNSGKEKRS